MSVLNAYLVRHFLDAAQLARAAGITGAEHEALVQQQLVPAPSYVVSPAGRIASYVFGEMAAHGATPGSYFHPSQTVWIARAREALRTLAPHEAAEHLQQRFVAGFGAALAELDRSTYRLADSFDAHGASIVDGLAVRTDSAWLHFLKGTFGLCVANPVSEAAIARKEVLQEKLTWLSENGSRFAYDARQASALRQLIDAYADAAMPFSPAEYPISSRKRLVADLRAKLYVVDEVESAKAL